MTLDCGVDVSLNEVDLVGMPDDVVLINPSLLSLRFETECNGGFVLRVSTLKAWSICAWFAEWRRRVGRQDNMIGIGPSCTMNSNLSDECA